MAFERGCIPILENTISEKQKSAGSALRFYVHKMCLILHFYVHKSVVLLGRYVYNRHIRDSKGGSG